MVGLDGFSIRAEGDGALEFVLELTNISGPVVVLEKAQNFRMKSYDLFAVLFGGEGNDVSGDFGDILETIPKRGNRYGKAGDPVVEILPEIPLDNLTFQVSVGGA
tara:strand:- start:155 stop:469 length:315 start_codon:yes stop_codon:yes gene_type:complete